MSCTCVFCTSEDLDEKTELASSGYHDCDCCGEITIDCNLCDSCIAAGCEPNGEGVYDACAIPQCHDCEGGEGPRASFMSNREWSANCDDGCKHRGTSWRDEGAVKRFEEHVRVRLNLHESG